MKKIIKQVEYFLQPTFDDIKRELKSIKHVERVECRVTYDITTYVKSKLYHVSLANKVYDKERQLYDKYNDIPMEFHLKLDTD